MPHTNVSKDHTKGAGWHHTHHANDGRVLINGDGQIVVLSTDAGANTGGGSGTNGTGTPPTPASGPGTTASPFVINVTYSASVSAAPAGFVTGVRAAVQYLQSQFTDPVTINITVGYGEVAGAAMSATALGTTLIYLMRTTYKDIANALQMAGENPLPNGSYWVPTAHAKAIGLAGPSTATDGYVGFSGTQTFDFDRADGITAGTYDFFGIAMHEFTEVMGRMLLTGRTIGTTANGYYPMDLFQYAAPGTRDFSATGPGYFSADGGVTSLGTFNTVAGGDAGDWGATMGNNAFNAFSYSGVVNAVSNADLGVLDAIGWDRAAQVTTASTQPSTIAGTAGRDTIDIAARLGTPTTPAFINGLAGNDTLNGVGMASALWLKGGAGADRLTGGSGANTYQFDAAGDSTARAMDIITNFNASTDLLDLTGLATALRVAGPITSGKLAAGSIGWQTIGGNTFVYVNTSTRSERLTGTDMKIQLSGNVPLGSDNIAHM